MADSEWIEIGRVVGDTGPKGDTGDIGIGTVIKGHYNNYAEFITMHPSGTVGDAYIVDGSYYYWNENGWANAGSVKGDTGDTGATGPKGDKGDTGLQGIKGDTGEAFRFDDFTPEQLDSLKGATGDIGATGPKGDAGASAYVNVNHEAGFIDIGVSGVTSDVINFTELKGDTGATGTGLTIKGSYNTYAELISEHPTGESGDSYLVNGSLYVWNGNNWENVGNIKGEKGDTGLQGIQGVKGDTGDSGFAPIINVDHETGQIVITTSEGSSTISFNELKGEKGDTGLQGIKGDTGEAFTFDDFTPEQLASLKGATGDIGATGPKGDTGASAYVNVNHEAGFIDIGVSGITSDIINFTELKGDTGATGPQGVKGDTGDKGSKGDTGDTGQATDENAGWKLPVDAILTTTTLPTGVSAGYRVAIVTSSVMAIKKYNGSSWETESLDAYSVIPLKHSGSIQMYLAKSTGPVYMGVDYGIFGKFRFMTQAEYDALSSYDNDTIYFVRSS